jgi:hypothetical protein
VDVKSWFNKLRRKKKRGLVGRPMPVFVFADAQFFHRVTKFVHYYHCIIIIIQIPEGHAFSKRK